MNPVWLLIPIAVGLVQPLLWQMNVRVSKASGDMESAVLLHLVGTVVGLLWVMGGVRGQGFSQLGQLPWWAWLAGAIGVTGMAGINRAIPEIGVAAAMALVVAAQFAAAIAFEHFGLVGAEVRPATLARLAGALLLALGAWLITRRT